MDISNESLEQNYENKVMAVSSLIQDTDKSVLKDDDKDRLEGQGYYRLAKVYYDKADLDKAKTYFHKALDKTIYPRDSFAILKIYGFLIRVSLESLDENDAKRLTVKAEELIERLSMDLGSLTSEFFYNHGMLFNYQGKFELALEKFKLAYQKAQLENEPELMAKALYSMSNASYHLEQYNESINHLQHLNELLKILNKGYLKGSMYMLFGNIYRDMNEPVKAMENYDLAIVHLQKKNCWNLYGYLLLGKGIVLKRSGEFNQALSMFKLGLNTVNNGYKRLRELYQSQVADVNDSSVDLFLDRHNRVIHEKKLGVIDFKHRFVLLEILFLLAKNSGQAYNKEDLAKSIWKDEYNPLIHDKLIYTSISRLRKLIEPKGGNRKYILRDKDGYIFNPRVNARFHKETDQLPKNLMSNVEINSPV